MKALYCLADQLPRWLCLGAAISIYALMLYLGTIERTVDDLPGRADFSKLYHLVFYFGLAGLLWFGLRKPSISRVTLLIAAAGAIDEFHQIFFPFREARFTDVLIDIAAGLAAALILHHTRRGILAHAKTVA